MVTSVAAISSVISQPIMGWLCDRTPFKWIGRRNMWICAASIVGGLGLLLQSSIHSTVLLAIVWAALMWPLNSVQSALATVLPERVPVKIRGSISGVCGAAQTLGQLVGVSLAGLSTNLFVGYLFVAASFMVICQIFAFTTKEYVLDDNDCVMSQEEVAAQSKSTDGKPNFSIKLPSFKTARDFWWAFIGRFLMVFGYFSVASFQLYILRDHIQVGDINACSVFMVTLTSISTVAGIIASVLGGFIADKLNRLKLFVVLATLCFVPGGIVYWVIPTKTGAMIAMGIIGFAFGLYTAVDVALISRVLPSNETAAQDLGIMNIATAGPQIIAPAAVAAIVALTGSYTTVFAIMIVSCILGAIGIYMIKNVR